VANTTLGSGQGRFFYAGIFELRHFHTVTSGMRGLVLGRLQNQMQSQCAWRPVESGDDRREQQDSGQIELCEQ
jgi:hypothetical protein